jgi:hypothetical protein
MRGVRYSMARQCLHAAVSDDGLKTLKGVRMIVKKEADDPDDVLNCYPFSALGEDGEVFIRLMTIQSKDGEKWPEPNAKLIKLNPDFLLETKTSIDFKHWVGDAVPQIESTDNRPGYAVANFPYGQTGSIEIEYESAEDISEAYLILSDNYMDISNFTLNQENEHYREYMDENYFKVRIEPNRGKGYIKIMWDNNITVDCNGEPKKFKNSFPRLNHLGILISDGKMKITYFSEESRDAWLETGIKY